MEYIKDIGHDGPHHFFSKNEGGQTRGTHLDLIIQILKSAGKDFDLYRVPLPMFSEYEATDSWVPDVDGVVFIGHWGTKKFLTH